MNNGTTAAAVADAATLLEPIVESSEQLVIVLEHLAFVIGADEPAQIIADELGVTRQDVSTTSGRVSRGQLGEQNVGLFAVRGDVDVSPERVSSAFSRLRAVLPDKEADYIRIEMPDAGALAFADYEVEDFVLVDRRSDDIVDLDRPEPTSFTWADGIERLDDLAG